ncbi:hypothetical protein [Gordonia aurantiaca]|uniref:hypothetical protein n=1 Tax=Gordonia sp. B21 TaxID=3151852 RepID=UPI003267D8B7
MHPTDRAASASPAREDLLARGDGAAIAGLRVVAEHGLPERLVARVENRIRRMAERSDLEFRGITVTREVTLQSTPRGDLETVWGAPDPGDEIVVFVTEMPRLYASSSDAGADSRRTGVAPRRARHSVVVAELDREGGAAVLSLPAFGPVPRRRFLSALSTVVDALREGSAVPSEGRRGLTVVDEDGTDHVLASGLRSRLRLTGGMVRGNRPWRLIPTLTGMTAAAAAAASFGVFFSTIWSMANALSSWRLAAITVLSIVLASLWLIVNNRLWERHTTTPRTRARLYNTATVCTVAFSWIVLYALLVLATLLAAMIVIDESFLSSQLGFPAEFRSYVHLSWLATSMGIFAGALGSSVDSHDDVLRATYGYRERLRRQASEASEDSG